MRIGFDAKRVFHNSRGLGNYGRTLLAGLRNFYPDHEYILYTPPFKEAPEGFRGLSVRFPQSFIGKTFPSLWRTLLGGRLAGDKLDIYHGLSHELPLNLSGGKPKTVVTVHDLIFLRFPHFFPRLDRQVYGYKLRHSCQRADVVLAICEQTKRDLVEFIKTPEEKIKVIYQAVHPRFYDGEETWKMDTPYILFVGAFEARKNVLGLLSAFAQVKDRIEHDLVLIGQGAGYKKLMEEVIAKEKLQSRVHIMEDVASDRLPSFYRGASLFCYPSHFEGFGLPIVEALFCNTPVLTSRGSCFPEAAGEGAVYVDPDSVEEMAKSLEDILSDTEKRQRMAERGRAHVEKFHWRESSKNLFALYSDLG